MTDEEAWQKSFEDVLFLQSVGLDPTGSVAERLAGVRALIRKLRAYELTVEADARSGDFVTAVPGEGVHVVIAPDGNVLLVYGSGPRHD